MKQTHIHVQVRVFRVISKGLAIAQTHGCGLAIYGSVQISVGLVQLCRSQSRGCHSGYGSAQRGSCGKLHKIAAFHSVFSFFQVPAHFVLSCILYRIRLLFSKFFLTAGAFLLQHCTKNTIYIAICK